MFCPEEEREQRERAADALASCCFFGVTMDEYIQKIEDTYEDYFMKYLLETIEMMYKMGWDFDKVQKFTASHYSLFEDEKVRLLDKLADHFELNVFSLPPDITFIDDGKLEASIKNYSKEENDVLDESIQKSLEAIYQKRAMIKLLKERIEKMDSFERNLKTLRANLNNNVANVANHKN